ncbi:MAG: hypothetical protein QOG18_350 [Microbacteriaceae bacterium]|nr:conserved rane protein [Microbacteriaceae bacterium]MDQ1525737.1 hypothetical protein [Microbacteriaceae bacterium]
MSALEDSAADRQAYWPVPIIRAIPAAALGLAVTFSADHSARLGLISFGIFAVLTGAALAVLAWRRLGASGARPFIVAHGIIAMVAGVVALLFSGASIGVFFLLVTAFAAITGFLELYCGLRTRRRYVASTDWLVVGGLTIIAAVALLLVPPDLRQVVSTPEGSKGILDASVVAVGLLGAYGAVIAVYLLIAGFSAKWGPESRAAGTGSATSTAPDSQTKGGSAA